MSMHPIKKVYCRAFQTVFHLAIPLLPYRRPEILTGTDLLPGLFREKGVRRVLLVTDASIRGLGITAHTEELLAREGIQCTVYDRTVANPTTDNVEEARALYLANGCQAIIGFGGGSSIDCAKAVGARVAKPRQSLAKMKGILKVHRRLPLLIAVPTTAGTGSETTLAAVITDSQAHHKYPINDFSLIPRYAVLDYRVTLGLPPQVTASTGMDALTHAVEAYIGRSTTAETRAMAEQAVTLIHRWLKTAYDDGQNAEARRGMLEAAYCAGVAFTKSYVGYVHAVAHSLGGQYGTPHGLANAVLLPYVLEAYGKAAHRKLLDLAVAAGLCDETASPKEGAALFIQAIKDMKQEFGLKDSAIRVYGKDVPRLAYFAAQEANPLYPVPRLFSRRELEQFYRPFVKEVIDA